MKCFVFISFLLISFVTNAQLKLSPAAEIHIITCGPYQGEVYSAFGHSGIRVKDPVNKIDILYNYGVFDFDQPYFYLNFVRGYLNYRLAPMDYYRFRDYYIYYNRYFHEQVLNINTDQKQKLFDFLQWNALPENMYYYYDYFYDNCATRVYDALKTVLGDSVRFDGSYITTDYTIRDLTDIYLRQQPWGELGIDLCLGLPMDKKATPEIYMFLPDYIEHAFDHAFIMKNGQEVALVKEKIITYSSTPEEDAASTIKPWMVFTLLLIIGTLITYLGFKKDKSYFWLDGILFTVAGLMGWLFFLLWVGTDHRAAAMNLNLLWAIPLHFPMGLLLLKKKKNRYISKYFTITAGIIVLLLLAWAFLPQNLPDSIIPFVLLLGIRAFYVQYFIKKNERTQN